MRHSTVTALVVLLTAVALLLGWREWVQTQEVRAATLTTANAVARLKTRLAALRRASAAGPAQRDAVAPGAASRPTAVTRETMLADIAKDSEERRQALYETPSLQLLYEQSRKASYRAMFAELFHRLKLSPEQQERVVAALAASDTRYRDLEAIAKEKRLSPKDPGLKAQYAEVNKTVAGEMEAVLGPGAEKMIRQYTAQDRARDYVAACSGMLARVDLPLRPEQLEALTAAAYECAPPVKNEPLQTFTPAQWEQFAARAQTILSPEQWNELRSGTPLGVTGVTAGLWEAALNDLLTKTAGPNRP
jgi:hypothetical protein